MSLSIVLTCCNEVPMIFETYLMLSGLMKATCVDHEFIVVDDGSTAEVQKALVEFFRGYGIMVILSDRNEGRGAAVTKGIRAGTKEYVGFIDTDLEIPAHSLLVLHHIAVAFDADMVIAERVYRWNLHPGHLIRNLGSVILRFVSSTMLELNNLDTETGAKVFRRRAIIDVLDDVLSERWFWDTEIIAEALKRAQRVVEVPVVVTRRSDKTSTVRPLKDTCKYLMAMVEYRRRRRFNSLY